MLLNARVVERSRARFAMYLWCNTRGSHTNVTCRSSCNWDQKWNQAINVLFRSRSKNQDKFWV